jgi:hypothetical protein
MHTDFSWGKLQENHLANSVDGGDFKVDPIETGYEDWKWNETIQDLIH